MSDKEEWWEELSNDEQHAYLKEHPKSAKHLITHKHKVDYHRKGMEDAKRKIDYLDRQIEAHKKRKNPDPFKLDKLYDKLSVVDEDYEGHRHNVGHYSAKMYKKGSNGGNTPIYGDEDIHRDDEVEEAENTPETKKLTNAVITKFSRENPNAIVRQTLKAFEHDPKSQEAIHSLYAHVKHGKPINKRELKEIGKIAAVALLTGAGTVAVGPVSAIYLAQHMNDSYNHGKGLGPLVVEAVKDVEDASNKDGEDINTVVVRRMVEKLQKQLLETNNEESSSRIEHLIDTLEQSLEHYSFQKAETPKKGSKKKH